MTELAAGQRLGKYRVRSVLGRGGMGIVYLAEDETLGRSVALKVLLPALDMDPHFIRMFSEEARLVAGLQHPNILPIHSFERLEERFVLDMPYIEDGSLAHVREACHVSLRQTLRWICQILGALSECHRVGVIHRDVKPSNILLGTESQALLTDFGLAKSLNAIQSSALTRGTSSSFFVGTPRYAPPEAWADASPLPAWDVYSLGLILYEALAPLPYDGVTLLEMARQIVERPIRPLEEMTNEASPELCATVNKMVARETKERFQDAGEALEILMDTPEGRATAAAGQMSVRARKIRRRRLRVSPGVPGAPRHTLVVMLAIISILTGFMLSMVPYLPWWGRDAASAREESALAAIEEGVYEAFGEDNAGARDGTVWLRNAEGNIEAFGLYRQALWFAQGTADSSGQISLSGYWAEYTGSGGWVFRNGRLTLEGRRMADGPDAVFSVNYACEQDASQWVRTLLLRHARDEASQVDAGRVFAEHDFAPALLYMELAPRGATWIGGVELFLYSGAREPLRAKGVWDTGVKPAIIEDIVPDDSRSPYRLSIVSQHGQIQFVVHGLAPRPPFHLALSVVELFNVPAKCSASRYAEFPLDGDIPINAVIQDCSGEHPWDCSWRARNIPSPDGWTAEISLHPSEALQPAPGAASCRWRFSLSLVRGAENTPLAVWGGSGGSEAYMGRLLILE